MLKTNEIDDRELIWQLRDNQIALSELKDLLKQLPQIVTPKEVREIRLFRIKPVKVGEPLSQKVSYRTIVVRFLPLEYASNSGGYALHWGLSKDFELIATL
jgi:hypothetical protein